MVRKIQQGLIGLFERRFLVAKGLQIAGVIEILLQDQMAGHRHRNRAFKPDRVLKRNVRGEVIGSRRDQHFTSGSGGICRVKGGGIVRHAVADGPIIAHIDHGQHVADEHCRDVFDTDVINPDYAPVRTGQVQTEMSKDCVFPDHIHASAQTCADNRFDLNNLTIGGQLGRGPKLRQSRHQRPARAARPPGDAHGG